MARRSAHRVAAFTGAMLIAAMPAVAAPAAGDLVLKRVVLSTGGVGYFESEAQVTGDATLALDVPLDQVDDVLKSLVVYDSDGTVGEITLPGREPLNQSFVDLPFDRAALDSEIDLLNALRGAEIRVAAPRPISGRLLHVDDETVQGPGGSLVTRARVSVMTDQGLQQFALQDVDGVAFPDGKLQAQIDTALQRIAAYRDRFRRRLTLQLHGSASRAVRVGYVIAVPLWKASYRLSLAADPKAATARMQGWAVLENFSGHAWENVDLTLLSGNPVTFRQALYESYYVQRPSVPVESGSRVLPPPPDTGTMPADAASAAKAQLQTTRNFAALAAPAGAPMPMAAAPPGRSAAPAPAAVAARLETAAATEEGTQVSFTPPYKISVSAGQSLVLPLLDRDLPARRIDLYQPSVEGRHPLAAIELTNSGAASLPPGVLTLYQQAAKGGALYVGDARLAPFPAGDKRLLSYAVDDKVTVDRSTAEEEPVIKATIAAGTLHITRAIRWTTRYRAKAFGAGSLMPALIIDQPRQPDATLTTPDPKGVELSGEAYRIPLALAANGTGSLTVVEERPDAEAIALLDLDDDRLGAFAASAEIDPRLRQALASISARRQAIADRRAELQRLTEQRQRLADDEKRLRDNLAVLGEDPALRKRMLDQFSDAENAIEKLTATIDANSSALANSEQGLRQYVLSLNL